jgi:pimeloyl-ACP methyl ester carboxylesterase
MEHRIFNAQVPALIDHCRVLVWDMRGHGRSQPIGDATGVAVCADDLVAILDEAGVDRAVLVGHSYGGFVAQTLYGQRPERVRALLLFDTSPIARAYPTLAVWFIRASVRLMYLLPYTPLYRLISVMASRHRAVRCYIRQAMGALSRDAFLRSWDTISEGITCEGRPALRLACPLLLARGARDPYALLAPNMMPRWAATEPNARHVVIPRAGHNANQDNPAAFNAAMLAFLDEVATASTRGLPT